MSYELLSSHSSDWDELISTFPDAHILQTGEWRTLKEAYGWHGFHYVRRERNQIVAAALVLKREISALPELLRTPVLYVPKGPLLLDWSDQNLRGRILSDLKNIARDHSAMFIKIDPDVQVGVGETEEIVDSGDYPGRSLLEHLRRDKWQYSPDQIQFKNTVVISLVEPEDELLSRMKQKTRYNIRLASRKGVKTRIGTKADFDMLYRMYAETSVRDDFVIRDAGYYKKLWSIFAEARMVDPIIAEVDGNPVAGLVLFYFARRAYYLHGMSRPVHREKMPNYLLQWEAMRRAKKLGCLQYDLWGAPEQLVEEDPLWNVYRFKAGFGGEYVRHIGAWDLVNKPLVYWLFVRALPRGLDILRSRGMSATRMALEN